MAGKAQSISSLCLRQKRKGFPVTAVFEVADILIAHARQVHGNDLALVAYYGSYALGEAKPTSDLDLYCVVEQGKTEFALATFILEGLPYDFGGKPWWVLENIANAKPGYDWIVSASQIADAKVLYSRAPADLERFEALRARIGALTRPESRAYMVERAMEEFQAVLIQRGQMQLALAGDDLPGLRLAGWRFTCCVANCLALVNQAYFAKSWGANLAYVLDLPLKPPDLQVHLNGILQPRTPRRELDHADRLTVGLRQVLLEAQGSLAAPREPKDVFVNFYFDVHEYKTKVLSACERGDVFTAGAAAFALQQMLCELMDQVLRGAPGTDFNLLGEYSAGYLAAGFPDLTDAVARADLASLARQVQALDEKARAWFPSHGIKLNILASESQLREFLAQKRPERI